MESELGTEPVLCGNGQPVWRKRRMAGLTRAGLGTSLVGAATGAVYIWALNDLHTTVGTLAIWVAALVLVVAALVALAHKGRHAGWFHPLSLPFATLAVMSLGAPLWVYFTQEPVGLLYDSGYRAADASTLAMAVSVTACEALTLVVAGYVAGAFVALRLTRQANPLAAGQRCPTFRYRDMRRAGFLLMTTGTVARLTIAFLQSGTTYGANQLQYGLAPALSSGGAAALSAGLILVTLTASHTAKPKRLRDLLRGREWAALLLYMLAVAVTGQRGVLISPLVYLAWVYSTQVRVITFKWIITGVLLTLMGGAAISNYRAEIGLSPGSPGVIIHNSVAAVSSSAWLTQQTVTYVPFTHGYTHGSTYIAAIEAQLPGPLSRAMAVTSRTGQAVFRDIIEFYDPNQGFGESYPSEAYLNFGLPGCFGAGLFLGALMGWAWRKHRETAARPRDLLYAVLIAGLIWGFRSDALTQIKEVLYPVLTVWILMGWYRSRFSAVSRSPAAVWTHRTSEAITGHTAQQREAH